MTINKGELLEFINDQDYMGFLKLGDYVTAEQQCDHPEKKYMTIQVKKPDGSTYVAYAKRFRKNTPQEQAVNKMTNPTQVTMTTTSPTKFQLGDRVQFTSDTEFFSEREQRNFSKGDQGTIISIKENKAGIKYECKIHKNQAVLWFFETSVFEEKLTKVQNPSTLQELINLATTNTDRIGKLSRATVLKHLSKILPNITDEEQNLFKNILGEELKDFKEFYRNNIPAWQYYWLFDPEPEFYTRLYGPRQLSLPCTRFYQDYTKYVLKQSEPTDQKEDNKC